MNTDAENVKQAKESFNSLLGNQKYAGIIKDDKHLSLLLDLVNGGKYNKIVDIGTGTGYLAFPLAEKFPTADVEKSLYDMENDNGVIWVKQINVGNTIFVKQ